LIARTLVGTVNGLSVIGKTLSTDLCDSDENYKTFSVAITNTFWALGSNLGPFIGAVLYTPSLVHPQQNGAFVIAILGISTIPLAQYFLKNAPEIVSINPKICGQSWVSLLKQAKLSSLIFIYALNIFFSSELAEIIPYWASAERAHGGLGYDYFNISKIYFYMLFPQVIIQLIMYPIMQKMKGDTWILWVGHAVHVVTFIALPSTASLVHQKLEIAWIVTWITLRNIASFVNFATLQKVSNDVVQFEDRGKLNAIQMMVSSLFQIFGMFMGGWLISYTMTAGFKFPFNYYLVFLLLSLISGFIFILIHQLSRKTVVYETATESNSVVS
jgi:hypothetical protein